MKLSTFELFAVQAAISLLTILKGILKNAAEQAGLAAALAFLTGLASGQKIEPDALAAAVTFLQELASGTIVHLSTWESILVSLALSFLGSLQASVTPAATA